jgi:hypothetical protein
MRKPPLTPSAIIALGALALACKDATIADVPSDPGGDPNQSVVCQLTSSNVFDGGPGPDGIPSLVDPTLVTIQDAQASYMDAYAQSTQNAPWAPSARVVSVLVDGEAIAVPHNILWWHEIANIGDDRRVAVSYCPLTGSSIVFDATAADTRRFGVSGLLYQNNLIMFDEESGTLWPQMCRRGASGEKRGTALQVIPAVEMDWEAWKALHPDGRVISSETGYSRDYSLYPYADYEVSDRLLFPMPDGIDDRLHEKERVLGIPAGEGGIALPLSRLESLGSKAVLELTVEPWDVIVFWDGAGRAAAAYLHSSDSSSTALTFRVENDRFVDEETGSTWTVEGIAIDGPRQGERLDAAPGTFVSFWFAWAAFQPETLIWGPGATLEPQP